MCARRGFDDRGEFTARASGFPAEKRVRCSVLRDRRGRLRPMDGRAAGRERRPRLRALARTRPGPSPSGASACERGVPKPDPSTRAGQLQGPPRCGPPWTPG